MSADRPETYDIAIIGAGGAGLTAALYGARARRRTVVFERLITGGQIATTELVENYPGFPQGINGTDFAMNLIQQVERFGAELRYEDVQTITPRPEGPFRVETSEGAYEAHAVIATAGADYNKLGVPGENDFIGRGVSYCATCDAAFFQDEEVVVVGGGDAAFDEALFTTRYARKVWLVHRRETFQSERPSARASLRKLQDRHRAETAWSSASWGRRWWRERSCGTCRRARSARCRWGRSLSSSGKHRTATC